MTCLYVEMKKPMLTLADTVQYDAIYSVVLLSRNKSDSNQSNTHPSKPLPDHRCGVRFNTAFCPSRMTTTRKGFCKNQNKTML